ncbi:MAG TPA: hypothetical protein VFY67_12140 [Pyrinomonadaceae bacterium]|nr:hypothetical protein [Pyrinomonadaceae bacterium]
MFRLKRAWSSAATPLAIVCPTDYAIPPDRGYVFVDDCKASVSQHSADFVHHEARILRVMQNVAKQHGIEALVFDGKVPAVVGKVIDTSIGAVADVQTDHRFAEHALEMVRDETVAAADVEHVRTWRKHSGDFKRHVVSSPDLAASSHAIEATFDG